MCPSDSVKHQRSDENGKGTMGCRSGWVVGGLVRGCEGKVKGRQKDDFMEEVRMTRIGVWMRLSCGGWLQRRNHVFKYGGPIS